MISVYIHMFPADEGNIAMLPSSAGNIAKSTLVSGNIDDVYKYNYKHN